MEMAPVFSESELKISQDDRNNVITDRNKITFFIVSPTKKEFKPSNYSPPTINTQGKYYKYKKNLQNKRAVLIS